MALPQNGQRPIRRQRMGRLRNTPSGHFSILFCHVFCFSICVPDPRQTDAPVEPPLESIFLLKLRAFDAYLDPPVLLTLFLNP